MTLSDLKLGETAFVDKISGDPKLTKRLLSLGCIEGTEIILKSIAPLGDPIIINLRGFNLAIRKIDAKNIFVHK